jgi:indolepyruvate ferredoxin oxidoreductase alpha subunit
MSNPIRDLCLAPAGQSQILQGNIAFAVGCVRAGIHAADGYPGTPSTEVIDKGLSQVQDLITVGWSVNEAVAAGVANGHTLAGRDCVVTMKIPGLFQAGDVFTSGSMYHAARGAMVYFVASDFTPSSTQHLIDPRYLFKASFTPVFEPRSHQEMHEAAGLAAEISRTHHTQVVVLAGGALCHSEGMVQMMPTRRVEPLTMPDSLRAFNVLPNVCRKNYDLIMQERMPALVDMVENSPLNHWEKGAGQIGIITYGACDLHVREVLQQTGLQADILSLAFTNPLPEKLIREFCASIHGPVYIFEDGYRYVQEEAERLGIKLEGKQPYSQVTEWTPAQIAQTLGCALPQAVSGLPAVPRPPVLCAGCPYRLFMQEVLFLRKKGEIEAVFGDIGCNTLLYFMNALDTGLAMGASEAMRMGYVASRPDKAAKVISVIGDSTEGHSGLDATRSTVCRNLPGVQVILDNQWTAMTGGQPSPTSPANLAGQSSGFDLPESLKAHGANVVTVGAFDKKGLRKALRAALTEAQNGRFTTLVVREGACLQKLPASSQRVVVDTAACKKCDLCQICPGLERGPDGIPVFNNLCSGCGGQLPACVQTCPTNVLKIVDVAEQTQSAKTEFAIPPALPPAAQLPAASLPRRLSLAIRGVGGQGNLFFGKALTQLALLAGYGEQNIIKGETHGMSQMGGPVISTFGCGAVSSPVLLPGSAGCLIAMEKSECLRPGFLELLQPGGTVLMASTRILPQGLSEAQYPNDQQIAAALKPYHVLEVDVLARALALGDATGRIANVVMLGVLSTIQPFDSFPPELWLHALNKLSPKPAIWAANYAAFNDGRLYAQTLAL